MTGTDQHPRSAPGTLRDLVGEPSDFFDDVWNTFPYQYQAEDAPGLLTPAELWDEFDCGLIVRPWVSLTYPHGLSAARRDAAFQTRVVVNNDLVGYPVPEEFRRAYEGGASIVVDRPELWSPRIAALVASLAAGFRGDVWSTLVLAPPHAATTELDAAPDGGHSFVLHLAGHCSWTAGGQAPGAFSADLAAGGVLYLPPGCERTARIGADGALMLVISVVEIMAGRLAEIMGALFLRGAGREIEDCHHEMTSSEKIAWVREALCRHLAEEDPQQALAIALRNR
ncbi:hypothetical protein EDD27_0673 [Nonomuraea polychroma]|uniref:Uncharacterized protein n=1 Tax=Nonomuraea polychroma TaxID=46176 RepID=A0A438LYJ9_9ACTN|nr:hypothetical protein [Nonomuraea polychroma]RVX38373.1 hypothetical protein EDD27_0673 [Nonomuraea polychroma]